MPRKIIFYELNEVPFRIIDDYCKSYPQSALARHLPYCHQFETIADDVKLSPWITWPTLHRGVTDEMHGIRHLGQDPTEINRTYPPIWEMLRTRGIRVGVCGSLFSYPIPKKSEDYAFYIPDPFALTPECIPADASVFQEYNLAMSRRSGRNVSEKIPWKLALRLVGCASRLGITMRTLLSTTQQLISEMFNASRRVRRRTFQSLLAFDVFLAQLKKTRPSFATFFTNHVASAMHRYWRAAYPSDYDGTEYDRDWIRTYQGEVDFAMSQFNLMFEKLTDFVESHSEYELWITSSMGQEAYSGKPVESQILMANVAQFMARLGFEKTDWAARPAMVPQVNVMITNSRKIDRFKEALKQLSVGGKPVENIEQQGGFFSISLAQSHKKNDPEHVSFEGELLSFGSLGLKVSEVEDRAGTTAYHAPEGILLIYDRQRLSVNKQRSRISTRDIAPKILNHFSAPLPDYLRPIDMAMEFAT